MIYQTIKISLSVFLKLIVPTLTTSIEEYQILSRGVEYYFTKLSLIEKASNITVALKRAKTIRSLTLSYLGGSPKFVVLERIKINKVGLPADLGPLGDYIIKYKDHPRKIAGILTILSLTKAIRTEIKPDFTPIIKEYTGKPINELVPEILQVVSELKLKPRKDPSWIAFHLTAKKGPNKSPALLSSMRELGEIKRHPKVIASLRLLGGLKFQKDFDALLERIQESSCDLRRLTAIADKEGKTRLIGIIDYWTQTVLKPFHDQQMGILKNIPQDMTFDQGKFTNCIPDGPYFSFDLSNATDRLPLSFQKVVFSAMYGEEKSEAWDQLLSQLAFSSERGPTVFAVGQPLGAYTSWTMFTISHHVILRIAAKRAQVECKYILLGDDIMIHDTRLATEYKRIIEFLGVEISDTKTLVSDTLFQFANRVFLKKEEVSPFTISGLPEVVKSPPELSAFLASMASHGWTSFSGPMLTPETLSKLLMIYDMKSQKRFISNTILLNRLPLRELIGGRNALITEFLAVYRPLDCFGRHQSVMTDYVLLAMRENLIKDLLDITTKFSEWKQQFPDPTKFFVAPELEGFKLVLKTNAIPWVGAWSALHLQTLSDLTRLRDLMLGKVEMTNHDFLAYRSLSVLPNPARCLKERNHVVILHTQARTLKTALRLSRIDNPSSMFSRIPNPFEDEEEEDE